MTVIKKSEEWNDQYYNFSVRLVALESASWRGHGRIYRKDTQETVDGTMSSGPDPDKLEAKVVADLALRRSDLPRPPFEWGLVKRRELVLRHREYRDEPIRMGRQLEALRSSNELSEQALHEGLKSFVAFVSTTTRELERLVGALDEADRQAFVRAGTGLTEEEQASLDDDEIDDRWAIFDQFLKVESEGKQN